ncbi:flagellar hook-length control protein FliK [Ferrimonas pelagia]|uniref:Flagellar hook-length control protein-like C-terminal domain-containing protein n=1 Tax=Ferrimonas pelagia TaxID=1177826 RepID=A0ABP9EBH1_9GAMM
MLIANFIAPAPPPGVQGSPEHHRDEDGQGFAQLLSAADVDADETGEGLLERAAHALQPTLPAQTMLSLTRRLAHAAESQSGGSLVDRATPLAEQAERAVERVAPPVSGELRAAAGRLSLQGEAAGAAAMAREPSMLGADLVRAGGQGRELQLASALPPLPAANSKPGALLTTILPTGADVSEAQIAALANTSSQSAAGARPVNQWGPVTLAADNQQWARELLNPLQDQLRFQSFQQVKTAELRLDPPDLGKIELNVRLDGDRLVVQMNAANPSVREALQQNAERLRDDLAQAHGGKIDVDVGDTGSQQHASSQSQSQPQSQIGVAAAIGAEATQELDTTSSGVDARA